MKSNQVILYGILVAILIGGLIYAREVSTPQTSVPTSPHDSFAQCLSDAGAKFYGTFWCPHCKKQKELFQNSKKLPYIECSTPNGQGQLKICADAGITSYPTWVFADSSQLSGKQTFENLSEKTGCAVPVTQ